MKIIKENVPTRPRRRRTTRAKYFIANTRQNCKKTVVLEGEGDGVRCVLKKESEREEREREREVTRERESSCVGERLIVGEEIGKYSNSVT